MDVKEFLGADALEITSGDLNHHEELSSGEALVVIIEGKECIVVLKIGSRGLFKGEIFLHLLVLVVLLGLVHVLLHCRELILISLKGQIVVVSKRVKMALPNGSDSDNAKISKEEVKT
jgi:hypothetical protein